VNESIHIVLGHSLSNPLNALDMDILKSEVSTTSQTKGSVK
jgi:hypothetical protein